MSKVIKKKLNDLIKEYEAASNELHLAITVYSAEQTEKELNSMHKDIEQTMKLVGTLNSSIEVAIEDVGDIKEDSQTSFTPPQIPPNKLTYPANGKPTDIRGRVYKRMLNLAQEVACKPISKEQLSKKLQSELAILKKMDICKNIIRFHGISQLSGEHVIIFDWAEFGTLKETYERCEIDWSKRLLIARDICSGLVYLHECSILHHDIRCESILVVDTAGSFDVKIANFNLSRGQNEYSREIESPGKLLPWLAPEKMRDSEVRYDVKCETYSFGMLLWELGHRRVPYSKWRDNATGLQEYVLSGKREKINFGLCTGIQACFEKIIKKAWQENPMIRPLVQGILLKLQLLCEIHSPTLPPQRHDDRRPSEPSVDDDDFKDFEDDEYDNKIEPVISLEEGQRAHKGKKHDIAWKCFDVNAELGNSRAKYWKGYYYNEGYYVKKNEKKAMELFKEAADEGVHEAQLRYASILIRTDSSAKEEFLDYLTKSAVNGNSTARFNLGSVYYNGRHGIPMDKKKGLKNLRLAAASNHPKALKMLQDNNEDINDN